MRLLVARSLLVGASLVLLAVGVLAPSDGWSRATVLVAAACCAGLDVLVVRSAGRTNDPAGQTIVAPAPPDRWSPPQAAPVPVLPVHPVITAGRRPDGGPVELDVDGRRAHIVVSGVGALAHAVFRALAVQVHALTERRGPVVRSAAAIDVEPLVRGALDTARADPAADVDRRARCPPLPEGTAVVAVDPSGPSPLTLVLVRGLAQLPRRWDLLVEVTRYGCTVRRPGDSRGTPIVPALPVLGADGADTPGTPAPPTTPDAPTTRHASPSPWAPTAPRVPT